MGSGLMIRDYMKRYGPLITDGAMGTYFYERTRGKHTMAEWANIHEPELIKDIHEQYIEAGAKILRTNTFAANSRSMEIERDELKVLIQKAFAIATEAVGSREVLVAADIGPLPSLEDDDKEQVMNEYTCIIDSFVDAGAKLFWIETLSTYKYLDAITGYIKEKCPQADIFVQFAIDATGHTVQGISVEKLLKKVATIPTIDYYGLNCGMGPTHMYTWVKKLINKGYTLSTVLPNAGYPTVENGRMIYPGNPIYFGELMRQIHYKGAPIIGGCCGTTPEHIRQIAQALDQSITMPQELPDLSEDNEQVVVTKLTNFMEKLNQGIKVCVAELDPPYGVDVSKIIKGATTLKGTGLDLITIADSPLGRARLDSVAVAAKIKREVGIDVMPHICCRDSNSIGLKSKLLACHMEGIRHILAVTGDPVPSVDRGEVKGVFHFNSQGLMELITEMNDEVFLGEPVYCGGALNLNIKSKEALFKRLHKKNQAGASYYLTQPVYDEKAIDHLKCLYKETDFKILVGIMPIVSLRNALYMNNEVPGIQIPESIIERFKRTTSKEEAVALGIEVAYNTCKEVLDYAHGLYFMTPFNRVSIVNEIYDRLRRNGYVE